MGLHSSAKERFKLIWAPESFLSDQCATVKAGNQHVYIVDFLTRWKCIPNSDTALFTMKQLADFVLKEIRGDICVIVCDDRSNTPKLKSVTQAKRVVASAKSASNKGLDKATPYPVGAHFNEAGMVCYVDEDGCEVVDFISIPRLSLSRSDDPKRHSNLGNELWTAMHPYVEQHMKAPGRATKQVFWDHKKEEIYNFSATGDPSINIQQPHDLGESDTAHFWWLKQYDGKVDAVHIRSIDGDNIALYAAYHDQRTEEQKAKTRVFWHCEPGVAVDLAMLVEHMLRKEFLHPETSVVHRMPSGKALCLYLILCDTDFLNRGIYAHGFGVDDMLIAFLSIDWSKMNALKGKSPSLLLEHFLVLLHHRDLPDGKVVTPEPQRKLQPLVSIQRIRERYREKEALRTTATVKKQQKEASELIRKRCVALDALTAAQTREIDDFESEKLNEKLSSDRSIETVAIVDAQLATGLAEMKADHRDACRVKNAMYAQMQADLTVKHQKQLDNAWFFPNQCEIDWSAKVLLWNYQYWVQASDGKKPVEPKREARELVSMMCD